MMMLSSDILSPLCESTSLSHFLNLKFQTSQICRSGINPTKLFISITEADDKCARVFALASHLKPILKFAFKAGSFPIVTPRRLFGAVVFDRVQLRHCRAYKRVLVATPNSFIGLGH